MVRKPTIIRKMVWMLALTMALPALSSFAADSDHATNDTRESTAPEPPFKVEQQETKGSVTVEGKKIQYDAYAGTLIVHPEGWSDVAENNKSTKGSKPSVASMFYTAYFKTGDRSENRPITFLYNGGPGSATLWLHIGAFGPRRVVTADHTRTPPAPYKIVNNDYSLLDASDLVFIDAPGAGFSRIAGTNREKDFYGVDQDAYAFSQFVKKFLTKYGRWNSPRYLFGESYGTLRNAALAYVLARGDRIDLNGIIMLSQILMYDANVDSPQYNPGVDLPYVLALPSYAATAWYHHKLPGSPADLQALLKAVEHYATGEYATALLKGATISADEKHAVAEKLHQYTGLPVAYIEKANLRVNGGEFRKQLQADTDTTTGRLDSRFSGVTIDPLSQRAAYDPQAAGISSAYLSAFNDYVRKDLKFGDGKSYRVYAHSDKPWDSLHQPPNSSRKLYLATNVMPDLAWTMKNNPNLKVMLNAGYFDLATPFFEGVYEMHHLPMPAKLQKNIEYKFYESGHMVYAHEPSLKALHDNVAAFIEQNSKH